VVAPLPARQAGEAEAATEPAEATTEQLGAAASAAAARPAPPPPPGRRAAGREVWVRVGLKTDLPSVILPCCDEALTVDLGGGSETGAATPVVVVAPLKVEPAAAAVRTASFRFQVAALKDEGQARELARRLGERLGQPADAHFDAGIDLYRVRVGAYPTRAAAEIARPLLGAQHAAGSWLVQEGGGLDQPALRVTQNGRQTRVAGRWLALDAASSQTGAGSQSTGGGIRVDGQRYRGRILVFLNDRGSLNLINELPLEDYLRGVVPREMGPEVFGRIEALKAQAVAARTYTLHNLGEFAAEGYDICATPRCHVYGGMEAEHPLTDRAIAETAGQVLVWDGKPIDALYTSTCGGHTEDVSVVFPAKDYPYLAGVPCYESGLQTLSGSLPRDTPFPHGITRRLLPVPAGGGEAAALAARIDQLAVLAGLPPGRRGLESLDRRAVQRLVSSVFDLVLDARLFVSDADLAYLLEEPPADWDQEDLRRTAFLVQTGLMDGPLDQPLAERERERLLLGLAQMLGVLEEEPVRFVSLADRQLTVRPDQPAGGGAPQTIALPPQLATFRLQGEGWSAGDLKLVAGDRLRLWRSGEALVGLVQEIDPSGVAFDRSSKWSSWTRFRSDRQLAQLVEERYAGLGFESFEILERGASGRVGKIRLQGTGGATQIVEGLAVRWVLDLPETLFTARRVRPPGRAPGWSFHGKGWGHGVGMCQVGAYGMAGRNQSYRDILSHYYRGATLVRVRGSR
jgi:stage II sporulation protein D